MTSKRKKHLTSWKVIRRCVVFFTTICVIPVLLFLMVTTDQYMRPIRSNRFFLKPQGTNLTHETSQTKNTVSISSISSSSTKPMLSVAVTPVKLGYTDKVPHSKMSKNMTAIGNRLERRKQFLKRACKNLGLNLPGNDSLHKPNPWEFLVSTKYHLIWCNIFKAASSSWMYNFNILAGYTPDFLKKTKQVALNLARQKYPRQTVESLRKAFNNSLSFLIVRHPLERLLSGYRDKIEHALPHSLHKKLGNQIIMKYRPLTATGKSRRTKVPTFEEFVLYLLDCVKNGETLDMHWTPIAEFCTPCMFDFDIVAHTETLQEDQEYLILKAGLQEIIKPEWKNSGKGMTSQQVDKYYSQLTRAQILQLYHIYRYDFELFNYTLSGYLNVGIMDKDPAALLDAINMKDLTRKFSRAGS